MIFKVIQICLLDKSDSTTDVGTTSTKALQGKELLVRSSFTPMPLQVIHLPSYKPLGPERSLNSGTPPARGWTLKAG